jgi:hypothetical protein
MAATHVQQEFMEAAERIVLSDRDLVQLLLDNISNKELRRLTARCEEIAKEQEKT